jgi:hypothetical protein
MQKATASFNHSQLYNLYFLAKLARLLLQLHNHNSIYTWRSLVILREIVIQEVHPCLAGQLLNEARVAVP